MAHELSELIKLANRVLTAENSDEVLAAGEQFAAATEKTLGGAIDWKKSDIEKFQKLHAQVSATVVKALDQTKAAIRDTKKKGKGLRKYTAPAQKPVGVISKKKI